MPPYDPRLNTTIDAPRKGRKPGVRADTCISLAVVLILIGPLLVWGYRWAFGVL